MTEKRFTLAYEKGNWWAVKDGDITLWKEETIALLNSLNGENEHLKKENKQLLCTIVEILDFIEDKREVSIEEMGRWWKEKEKELKE